MVSGDQDQHYDPQAQAQYEPSPLVTMTTDGPDRGWKPGPAAGRSLSAVHNGPGLIMIASPASEL